MRKGLLRKQVEYFYNLLNLELEDMNNNVNKYKIVKKLV